MKQQIFLFLMIGVFCVMNAQDTDWVKSIGGSFGDNPYHIKKDNEGNFIISGRFSGSVDFDPNEAEYWLSSNQSDDYFILKIDSHGNFLWAKSLVHEGTLLTYHGLDVDHDGYIYIAGVFSGTLDCDPGADTFEIVSGVSADMFVTKLDSDGNFIWAKSIGGDSQLNEGNVEVDLFGNVFICGEFGGVIDFDPNDGVFEATSTPFGDAFVLKLDSMGNFNWAYHFGDDIVGLIIAEAMVTDPSGNVFVTGRYTGDPDFDPSDETLIFPDSYGDDIFYVKLSPDGDLLWAKRLGSPSSDRSLKILIDDQNNIYSHGKAPGNGDLVDFDPGEDTYYLNSADGEYFILKLDENGNFIWARNSPAVVADFDLNDNEEIYMTGWFEDTVDMNTADSTNPQILTSNGSNDGFIQKLDANGNSLWANTIGGDSYDLSLSIAFTNSNNALATGVYLETSDFNTNNSFLHTSNGERDIFLLKLVDNTLSSEDFEESSTLIYPNPSHGSININLRDLPNASIKVYSLLGQVVYQKENNRNYVTQIDLNLNKGYYFVEIISSKKREYHKLVVL
jgi:hypothetical protein